MSNANFYQVVDTPQTIEELQEQIKRLQMEQTITGLRVSLAKMHLELAQIQNRLTFTLSNPSSNTTWIYGADAANVTPTGTIKRE